MSPGKKSMPLKHRVLILEAELNRTKNLIATMAILLQNQLGPNAKKIVEELSNEFPPRINSKEAEGVRKRNH